MLTDLHCHSSGISRCCKVTAEQMIDESLSVGFDAIVLTNHYGNKEMKHLSPKEFALSYVEEYKRAASYGKSRDFPVFFGIEATMEQHGGIHMLIYGVQEDFLLSHPTLHELSLRELYESVHAAGGILVQAHPMRGGVDRLQDPSYLDGVEINCHKVYPDGTHLKELAAFASEHELILTCGCDYHADAPRPKGGTILSEQIRSSFQLSEFLYTTMRIDLMVEEPSETEPHPIRYLRGSGLI